MGCFLSRCGPPSSSEESALANKTLEGEDTMKLDEDEDSIMSSKTPSEKGKSLRPDDELDNSLASEDAKTKKSEKEKDDADDDDSKKDEKDKDKNGEVEDETKDSPPKDNSKESPTKAKEPESEKGVTTVNGSVSSDSEKSNLVPFPGPSDLNGRLRRLISSFQREKLKEMARQAAIDKRNERRERIEQVIKEREQQKIEMLQKRWNRREEK